MGEFTLKKGLDQELFVGGSAHAVLRLIQEKHVFGRDHRAGITSEMRTTEGVRRWMHIKREERQDALALQKKGVWTTFMNGGNACAP